MNVSNSMSEVDARSQTIGIESVDLMVMETEKDDVRTPVDTLGLEIQ